MIYTENSSTVKRQSILYYNGLQHMVHIYEGRTYATQPSTSGEISCRYSEFNKTAGGSDDFIHFLPDDVSSWKYDGECVILGRKTNRWIKTPIDGIQRWYYYFYADAETDAPVRLYMHGRSIMGSHPTDYFLDIEEFGPTVDESVFTMPDSQCISESVVGPVLKNGFNGFKRRINANEVSYCDDMPDEITINEELPKSFTWRDVDGVLQMPRDQATCGSCWAESVANAISAQVSLAKGSTQVSIQQIMDCTWSSNSHACLGGSPDESMKVLIDNRTILVSEEEYPYLGIGGRCRNTTTAKSDKPIARLTKCLKARPETEYIKKALYKYGPLSITIISTSAFAEYDGETVFKDEQCNNVTEQNLNHCVLLTGWKIINGEEAWEIQNSWSDTWGKDGYGYISTDPNYDCGIHIFPFLPIIEFE